MLHLDPDRYGAIGISARTLLAILKKVGGANATSLRSDETLEIAAERVHELTAYMLANGMGERFPVGDYELIGLRFTVTDRENAKATLLAVEEYDRPFPALVDGHATDRGEAIKMWLGDGDKDEHPDLYLAD
jgi:hypothetical protein